jgi:hypothetical protein
MTDLIALFAAPGGLLSCFVQDYFSVAIAANSFEDLNGWRNPEGSEYLWYLYDSTLPVVVSVIPSIPIQPYINDVTMNNTVFTVTFGEVKPTDMPR